MQVPQWSLKDIKSLEPAVVRNALADLQSRFKQALQVRKNYTCSPLNFPLLLDQISCSKPYSLLIMQYELGSCISVTSMHLGHIMCPPLTIPLATIPEEFTLPSCTNNASP